MSEAGGSALGTTVIVDADLTGRGGWMDIGIGLPNVVRGVDRAGILEWARRAGLAGFQLARHHRPDRLPELVADRAGRGRSR